MSVHRFSLRTLFLIVTLVAAFLACHRVYRSWIATAYSAYYVNDVLQSQVHNGDSVQETARHFNTARPITEEDTNELDRITLIWGLRQWDIEDGDEFHCFQSPNTGVYLQFRHGKLINHQNSDYDNLELLAQINRQPFPPLVLRYGAWPFFLAAVACILFANWIIRRFCIASRRGSARPRQQDRASGAD
jgi:hypothetical protein